MAHVELVYVHDDGTVFQKMLLLADAKTVYEAIQCSGILTIYPHVSTLPAGIFSKSVSHQTALHAGDRIEIYRPLAYDPKTRRRIKARPTKRA